MKVKSDFVTNSSSASYIMTFKPNSQEIDRDQFLILFNAYLERFKRKHHGELRYWDGCNVDSIEKQGITYFTVTEETSMHNGSEDIPLYMRELMVESYVKEFSMGFTMESFEIED